MRTIFYCTMKLCSTDDNPVIRKYITGKNICSTIGRFNLSKDDTINPEVLNFCAVGTERVLNYFQVNKIETPFKVNQSKGYASLKKFTIKNIHSQKNRVEN